MREARGTRNGTGFIINMQMNDIIDKARANEMQKNARGIVTVSSTRCFINLVPCTVLLRNDHSKEKYTFSLFSLILNFFASPILFSFPFYQECEF